LAYDEDMSMNSPTTGSGCGAAKAPKSCDPEVRRALVRAFQDAIRRSGKISPAGAEERKPIGQIDGLTSMWSFHVTV
jgi:hypothetical protein